MVTINKHLQKYPLVTGVMKQVTVIFRNQFLLHHVPTFVSQSNPSMTSIQIQEHKPKPPDQLRSEQRGGIYLFLIFLFLIRLWGG